MSNYVRVLVSTLLMGFTTRGCTRSLFGPAADYALSWVAVGLALLLALHSWRDLRRAERAMKESQRRLLEEYFSIGKH